MSSEDFKSFVVTDPDILDEGIDISGIKRTTDTSPLLLGDLQPGLRYDPTLQSSYSDLLQYFSGGLPMLPDPPAAAPPATGGGGTGGGGQATTPITTPVTTPTTGGGITNVDTPLTQMITDPVTGQTQTVKQAMTSDPAYTGTLSDPFLASGAAGGASLVRPTTATTTLPSGDVFATDDPMLQEKIDFTPEQQSTIQNILGQAGQTVGGALSAFGNIPGAIIDAANQTVDIFGKKINVGKTLAGAALNKLVGGPATLAIQLAEKILPDDNIAPSTNLARSTGLLQGDTTVTQDKYGINTQTSFDPVESTKNYNEYNVKQVDKLNDSLSNLEEKYKATWNEELGIFTDKKTGLPDKEANDMTTRMRAELKDRKEYLTVSGVGGDVEGDQPGITTAENIALQDRATAEADAIRQRQLTGDVDFDATPTTTTTPTTTGVNPFADIDTGVGEFDTTPTTNITTRGETVLGKPPIEKFDPAEAALSNTGTSIDALNPNNRQLHFDNTEKLREAARNGEITDAEYKRLSAFDATKTMGLDPVTGTLSSIAYQTVQAAAGDQTVGNAISDIANNISGVAGNITPEEQVKYQEIITGEKIYRDPILGMVEPPAPMTLADDFGDAFSYLDDIDISQDAPTAPEPTPTPTVPDFISGGGRDPDPAPSAPAKTSQGVTTSQFQAFRDTGGGADRDPAPSRPSAPVSTAGQAGPPSQRGGGGGGNGGGGGGGGKIVCTMMNESYGFGSFRNKIWLRHSKGLAPEYQKGYHKIFLPLVRLSKKNIVLKKVLEHIAVHRTIDIRQESRGKVHLLGRVYRKILEPICYWVGRHG